MVSIVKIKNFILSPLIKWVIKHPGIMGSKLFLKAMIIFPSKISKTYDERMVDGGQDLHKAMDQGLRRIFNKPQKIIDLCTGTGFASLEVAKVFPMSSIDAIDQITEMLDIARKKARKRGIQNIVFKVANAAKLNYKDNEFDLVVTSNAPIYLSEAVRVLRPGGLLLAVYSFGGEVFLRLNAEVDQYFNKNGIELLEIKRIGNGAYALGQKFKNQGGMDNANI
ncbi:MAG: methyltransferase domain-containing protein [Thermoplasmata archaeon]|nr:methyltransferase domain-containing protein [Thermoplasmata archaeon]